MSLRVLVTGGAGYIGSHTCKALAARGHLPVSYDNLSRGHRWAVRWGPLVEADLADAGLLRAALREHRIDAVMHFAAFCYVAESVREPELYFRNNTQNSLALLEAMRETGVSRMVFSSSCATYGAPRSIPMAEDHVQQPINPYGESKLRVEHALQRAQAEYNLRWSALRYFNASGADPDGEIGEAHDPETHLVPLALHAALGRRDHLEVYGSDYDTPDGTAVRDYVHVTDLAEAHVEALEREAAVAGSALNLGSERGHSVREVVAAVERVSGRSVPVRTAPRRAGDPETLVASCQRARRLLGWRPRFADIDVIVETALHWHERQLPERSAAGAG